MRRRLASFRRWVPLLLLSAFGCTGGSPSSRWIIAERWLPDSPTELYSRMEAGTLQPAFDWKFEGEELDHWQVGNEGGLTAVVSGGLRLRPGTKRPKLVRRVSLDTEQIEFIEAEIDGLRAGRVRLLWAAKEEPFSAERSVVRDARDVSHSIVRFDLTQHPTWTGQVDRLRLEPTSALDQTVVLRRMRGLEVLLPDTDSSDLFSHPWRFDLGHVVRSAMPLRPGLSWTRTVALPGNARLEFSYGLDGPLAEPLELVVETRGQAGGDLFRAPILPEDRIKGWRRATIDLSALAGQEAELAFRVIGPAEPRPKALIAVAEPIILAHEERTTHIPNVIFIVVDTLRADRISALRNGRSLTPNIDGWFQRRGVAFADAVAPAPWTLPSHISLFTGLDALKHGLNHGQGATSSLKTLAELLRDKGYHTAAITGGLYLHPSYGLDQGFDDFHYWPPERAQEDEIAENGSLAINMLSELEDRPFFLFLHTYEVHSPFHRRQPFFDELVAQRGDPDSIPFKTRREPPEPGNGFVDNRFYVVNQDATERLLREDERWVLEAHYDSGVAYTDVVLGRLFEELDERGLAENTMVVLTSDHGEALGEHGLSAHAYLFDFNLDVPLLLSLPDGDGGGKRIQRQVRLIDVPATIADVAGTGFPAAIDGRSLLPLIQDPGAPFPEAAWSYAGSSNHGVALRNAGYKLLYRSSIWRPGLGEHGLYSRTDDPSEEQNLSGERPVETRELVRTVEERLLVDPPGLLVLVRSDSTSGRELVLGPASPTKIKGIALPPAVQTSRAGGNLRLSVPPESRFGLRFESLGPGDELNIEIVGGGLPPCRLILPLADLRSDHVVSPGTDGCRYAVRGREQPGLTLELLFTGDLGAGGVAPDAPDLARKLEELGYL